MRTQLLFLILSIVTLTTGGAAAATATDYQLETRIRQLEIDQRMDQVQQDMARQSDSLRDAVSADARPVFSPTLPGYRASSVTSAARIKPGQVERYLEGLGNPEEKTGVFAVPPEERLYRYGLLCIDAGFIEEGVRAISEHMRLQAETHHRAGKSASP